MQHTIGQGERSSAATSYLTADVLGRSNLHVLLNSRTTKLVPSKGYSSSPRFDGIEVAGEGTLGCVCGVQHII